MGFRLGGLSKVLVSIMVCAASVESIQADESIADRAFRLRMDGKIDDAKLMLEEALKKEPQAADAWLELARLEFQRSGTTRTLDSAEKPIEQAIRIAPTNSLYYEWAARIAAYNGILKSRDRQALIEQFKKAEVAAERAVALDPDNHESRRILIAMYGNNPPELGGNTELAEKHVKALESRSPIHGTAARHEFSYKDKPDERLTRWKQLAKSHERDSLLQEQIALEYAWMGNEQAASDHAKKTIALNPKRSRILIELARAFALQKKLDPAEKFTRDYLQFDPPAPRALQAWALMALGRIQDMKGNKAASQESLNKARQLDPYCWFTMTPPPDELFTAP